MINKEQESKVLSAIIKMEGEMTQAVSEGYKPVIGDMFQSYRDQLARLRAILFDSHFINFCEMNKLHPLDDGFAYNEFLHCKELAEDDMNYNPDNNS